MPSELHRPEASGFSERAAAIIKERTPKSELCILEPTVEFLDPERELTREEMGRVVAMGDRNAHAYKHLKAGVVESRSKPPVEVEGEMVDATTEFYMKYAMAARGSNEIPHTSILEQLSIGPDQMRGDPPIVLEGISALCALTQICTEPHFGFEAFSSRGALFPIGATRVPTEIAQTRLGPEIASINNEVEASYRHLAERALGYYLQNEPRREDEKKWQHEWRVLSYALDDARQVTNNMFLVHFAMHPNNALAMREALVRWSSSELPETRGVAEMLRALAKQGMPNLMRHTEASEFTSGLPDKRRKLAKDLNLREFTGKGGVSRESRVDEAIYSIPETERLFIAAFIASEGESSFPRIMQRLDRITDDSKIGDIITEIFSGMTLHDKPPKELDIVQIVASAKLSVGAMIDLWRHRRALNVVGHLTIKNGFAPAPASFEKLGLVPAYKEAIRLTEQAYDLVAGLGEKYERVFGPYCVARAHEVHATLRMSGLDVFHIMKLRGPGGGSHSDVVEVMSQLRDGLIRDHAPIFRHLVLKKAA